jgi:hypothetical protein
MRLCEPASCPLIPTSCEYRKYRMCCSASEKDGGPSYLCDTSTDSQLILATVPSPQRTVEPGAVATPAGTGEQLSDHHRRSHAG